MMVYFPEIAITELTNTDLDFFFFFQMTWPFKVDSFQMAEQPDRQIHLLSAAWVYSKVEDKPLHALVLNLNLPSQYASKVSGPAEKHLRCGRRWDFGTMVMSSDPCFFGGGG